MPPIKLDHDSQTLVSRGREAWRSLSNDETWEKWVAIGRAIEAGKARSCGFCTPTSRRAGQWSRDFRRVARRERI